MSGGNTPHVSNPSTLDAIYESPNSVYRGPTRNVRLPRVCSIGGGTIAKAPDGQQCVVAGKESLRLLRISDASSQEENTTHKSSVGRGGHRIEASKNFWEGSGLKVDSAFTDAAWCHGQYSNKVLTSARNGELLMWDLNKNGSSKYERRAKDHLRSIHKVCVSPLVPNYSLTGSSDGDLRVWDLRDLRKSIIRIHHSTGLRGVAFSPVVFQPLQAVVGLDNGNIFRWDLKIGQRGRLDRIPVAHTGSVTSLDWCSTSGNTSESTGNSYGWIVSSGLDRTVKVWDLTQPGQSHGHISNKPTYTLHTSFPVRRALWRPSYECEIAIVSNADFGAGNNPDMNTPTIPMTGLPSSLQPPSTSTSRRSPTSGLGLDIYNETPVSTLTPATPRPRTYAAVVGSNVTPTGSPRITASGSTSGAGDLAEIWDCRRGWIAKWQITGSAVDGGLTDICFGADSHVVWGQHYSGMFSQIDLRDATRPIDAVPRVAVEWEAGGGLAFVAGRKEDGEVPYDDAIPEEKSNEKRKSGQKALGDRPFVPVSQHVGSFQSPDSLEDTAVFTRLAKEYLLEGEDRKGICAYNAQVAFDAGQYRAAQVWLLVEASLATLFPDLSAENSQSRPESPVPQSAVLSHSVSAPAGISGFNQTHEKDSPGRVSDHSSERVNSPNSYQQRSLSGGRRTFYTPSSSTNTSPRQALSGLPPTPLSSSSRRFSHLGRRNSIDPSGMAGGRPPPLSRRPSAPRRPSNSTHSASPSTSSLRHVGEGALDDSDSDSGSEGGDEYGCEDGSVGESAAQEEEEPLVPLPLISPALAPLRVSYPSPLSRVASQQWTHAEDGGGTDGKDDAEDEASPSPRSTDSEGDSTTKVKRSVSSRRSSVARFKTRSRSSTMASVQTMTSRKSSTRSILRHDSSTSIKTVTVSTLDISMPMRESEDQLSSARLRSDETSQELRSAKPKHSREKSLTISELVLNGEEESNAQKIKAESREHSLSHRQQLSIMEEEERYREAVWSSLRESIDIFAEEGDVQLCAMLAIVVPDELQIRRRRRVAFIDSYIERLSRLKLHVYAAYVRKYSHVEDIRSLTLLETTIYTACGRCRKPFIITPGQANQSRSGYTYCPRCRRTTSICSICRLPVRGVMFQCSVCAHGGHQTCYSQYYSQRAMEHVPHPTVAQAQTPTNTSSSENDNITSTKALGPTSSLSTISSRVSIDTIATNHTTTTNTTANTEEDGLSGYGTVDASSDGGALHTLTKVSRLVGRPCAAGCGHYCWVARVNGISDG